MSDDVEAIVPLSSLSLESLEVLMSFLADETDSCNADPEARKALDD